MHDAIVYALLKGTVRQPAAVVEGIAGGVSLPGARLRPSLRDLPGLRHRDDPRAARRRRARTWTRSSAWSPRIRGIKGMWCVPKYSNPTGTVYSAATVERLAAMNDRGARLPHVLGQRLRRASPDRRAHRDRRACVDACARHGHPNRAFVFGSTSKITLAGAGVALFALEGQRRLVSEADGQAHDWRRQDQPAAPRALPARHGRAAGR